MAQKSLKTYMIVSSVELLALPQLLLDQGELSLQETLLLGDQLQVQVQTAHALQLLQVEPASPPHTDAVEDEAAADVNLNNININNLLWEIPARRYREREGGNIIKNKDYQL